MAEGMKGFLREFENLGRALRPGRMSKERTLQILTQVNDHYDMTNQQVLGVVGSKYFVDEMAIYFPEQEMLLDFIKNVLPQGWRLFNYAEDNVITRPIVGSYAVEYWFLEHEELAYRLELMSLPEGEGFSPYHASLHQIVKLHHAPALAHASFKVANDLEYGNAMVQFKQAGYEVLQHCESTYGKFSYLRDEGDVPIKPRINLRDGGNDAQ